MKTERERERERGSERERVREMCRSAHTKTKELTD